MVVSWNGSGSWLKEKRKRVIRRESNACGDKALGNLMYSQTTSGLPTYHFPNYQSWDCWIYQVHFTCHNPRNQVRNQPWREVEDQRAHLHATKHQKKLWSAVKCGTEELSKDYKTLFDSVLFGGLYQIRVVRAYSWFCILTGEAWKTIQGCQGMNIDQPCASKCPTHNTILLGIPQFVLQTEYVSSFYFPHKHVDFHFLSHYSITVPLCLDLLSSKSWLWKEDFKVQWWGESWKHWEKTGKDQKENKSLEMKLENCYVQPNTEKMVSYSAARFWKTL